ncbi:MAG: hypothetical protein HYZ28_17655 [Myxococcales bacterium]|nr:hypothetical protein [Myxococcales bacterium]
MARARSRAGLDSRARRRQASLLLAVAALASACGKSSCGDGAPAGVAVGPDGGALTVAAGAGSVTIEVPAGALDEEVKLWARAVPERLPGAASPAIELGPHGTRFQKPVAIRFSPAPGDVPPAIPLSSLVVATRDAATLSPAGRGQGEGEGRWAFLPTRFPAPGAIEGETSHFSLFTLVSPCLLAGTGTDFPLTGCQSFNPRIQTSAPVTMVASAASVTVLMDFAGGGLGPTDVSISGLTPGWTYHLAREQQSTVVALPADGNGTVQFSQDAAKKQTVLLMAHHGTESIGPTGCGNLGQWDTATKTCFLTRDVPEPPVWMDPPGITLDCKDPVTGQRHLIGSASVRHSVGIQAGAGGGVTVRNCDILNVDVGIVFHSPGGSRVEDTSALIPPEQASGLTGFSVGGPNVTLIDVTAEGFAVGIGVLSADNVVVKGASLAPTTSSHVVVSNSQSALLEDVTLNAAVTLQQVAPGPTPLGAVVLSGSRGAVVRRAAGSSLTGFGAGVAAVFDSSVTVEGGSLSGAQVGIRLDGPGSSTVQDTTLTGNGEGLSLLGGANLVFHNNVFGNQARQVSAPSAVELSDTRASSPSFQQGNFWGRSCPGSLFLAGTDSNRSNVVDSFPYAQAGAWAVGGSPGCAGQPVLAAPILTSPAQGALLATASPTFTGVAAPGATVELLEGGAGRGSATADATGAFSLTPAAPFSDGQHAVTARASLGGATSLESAPLAFTVDTTPPFAPAIDFPQGGSVLVEVAPLVSGTAEAASRVLVKEGASTVGAGTADLGGRFSLRLFGLSAGAHSIAAGAVDAAGNTSPVSPAVAFTLAMPGAASALVGVAGRLQVTGVADYPDAFEPAAGESNSVRVSGFFNPPAGGSQTHSYELLLERKVMEASTGAAVRAVSGNWPLGASSGTVPVAFERSIGWDGKDSAGQLVPVGAYLSVTTVSAVEKKANGNVGGKNCLASLPGGGCVVDRLEVATVAVVSSSAALSRPAPVAAGTGIVATAVAFVPAASHVLVIPESAFEAALLGGFRSADEAAKRDAVALAGAGNDAAALGVVAQLQASGAPVAFQGQVFVVAREAKTSGGGQYVETADYYVAAVELGGRSTWVGVTPEIGADSGGSPPRTNCCGLPKRCSAGGDLPGGGGGGGPCGFPAELCPAMDTEVGASGTSYGSVDLKVYGKDVGPIDPPLVSYSCVAELFPGCTQVQPYCDPADYVKPGKGEGDQVDGCNGQAVGREVPAICQIVLNPDYLPPECGGQCAKCGSSSTWNSSGLPPACAVMQPEPGSDICRPHTAAEDWLANIQMWELVRRSGCRGAGSGPVSGTMECCGANCVCQQEPPAPGAPGGVWVCTECNSAGQCHQFAKHDLVDPTQGLTPEEQKALDDCKPPLCEVVVVVGTADAEPKKTASDSSRVHGDNGDGNLTRGAKREYNSTPSGGPAPTASHAASGPGGEKDSGGDPVLLGSGGFRLEQTDLSFDGPVRPLEFRRTYDSQGRARGTLGSNWHHNWDVRLAPLREGAMPPWASPYCAGSKDTVTCLLLYEGDTSVQLFALDHATGIYMPQAGSTDTVAVAQERQGWVLRRANGHLLVFDKYGYLTEDRDRFGNGFTISYEPTPLHSAYSFYCEAGFETGVESASSRRCAVLTYLLEQGVYPYAIPGAWSVTAADYPLPQTPVLSQKLTYARAYFLWLLSLGEGVDSSFGARRFRPTRVVDDLGRALTLEYYQAAQLDFANLPEAELLKRVSGPAGTELSFSYGRPQDYPPLLNEMFLVEVSRKDRPTESDVLAAPDRTVEFSYQWPEVLPPSYEPHTLAVWNAFMSYYGGFVGCLQRAPGTFLCGGPKGGTFVMTPGVPMEFGNRHLRAYISDVADNIVKVTLNGRVESETRYEADPFAVSFDRVYAQRYGSSRASQDETKLPPSRSGDNWNTTLPRFAMDYQPAGVTPSGGDRTDSSLPSAILSRYPLEAVPGNARKPVEAKTPIQKGEPQSQQYCSSKRTEEARKLLPGYRETLRYFEVKAMGLADQLRRSRLSCEALAWAQMSDVTHNDLLSELVPIRSTPSLTDHFAVRIVGQRARIAADANRICAWTKTYDRDGDVRYSGLNYRGQVLVDAVEEAPGQFLFTETLYNADGNALQERRPTRGASWTASDGHTSYRYDEMDSATAGNNNPALPTGGHSSGLPTLAPLITAEDFPAFWARRGNVLRVEEHPRSGSVVDVGEGPGGVLTTSVGRFRSYTYEPLFNQVRTIEEGSLPTGRFTRRPTHRRWDFLFDYQELSSEATATPEASIKPVLEKLAGFGIHSAPIPLLGKDLNGDGILGFPHDASAPHHKAKGVPIAAVTWPFLGAPENQVFIYTWAPHGKPSSIQGPDGAFAVFHYYRLSDPKLSYGGTAKPTANDANPGFRSFLAKVVSERFDGNYPASYGSSRAPCASLAGPYQWLLPSACANPASELLALGLPQEAVDAIVGSAAASGPMKQLSTAYSYSVLGKVRHVWMDTGEAHFVRDTDGRERRTTDILGNSSAHEYDDFGFPVTTEWRSSAGAHLGRTIRQFDEEGRLVYSCTERKAGGCAIPGELMPAQGVARAFKYTPEGQLRESLDGEGLKVEYEYDARKQLVVRKATDTAGKTARGVSYRYGPDGEVTEVHHGVLKLGVKGLLQETFDYDGLLRLRRHVNTRGFAWHFGHSSRDLLSRYKQDVAGYEAGSKGSPKWETVLAYDGLGRLTHETDNGASTTRYHLTNGGLAHTIEQTGVGKVFQAFDVQGRLLFQEDAAGNQLVYAWSPSPHEETLSRVRKESGTPLTTSEVRELDKDGVPLQLTEVGGVRTRVTKWKRGPAGFVEQVENPDGFLTKLSRNLLGWPEEVSEQSSASGDFDDASYSFDSRGRVLEVLDPSKQRTSLSYTAFGEVKRREVPGSPAVVIDFTFDSLGRLETRSSSVSALRYLYDSRGDAVGEQLLPGGQPISSRHFDELGRVDAAFNHNPSLSWLPLGQRTVASSFAYDSLGRVVLDSVQVGGASKVAVTSFWQLGTGGLWERVLSYPATCSYIETRAAPGCVDTSTVLQRFDSVGRFSGEERLAGNRQLLATSFVFNDELYLGRAQQGVGRPSPFREKWDFDSLAQAVGVEYRAIDLGGGGRPLDASEGASYCGGPWSPQDCAGPLFGAEFLRDRMGRVASLKWEAGHPVLDASGARVPTSHPKPWRGFVYDAMSRLSRTWENPGIASPVSTSGLQSHFVTEGQLQGLGASSEEWEYRREKAVGGTLEIVNRATGALRWEGARGSGHQLSSVTVASQKRSLVHDGEGRTSEDGSLQYEYDVRGWLSVVRDAQGAVLEAYAHDDLGRMVALFGGSGHKETFLHDGHQVVVSYDTAGATNWEASWGPGVDKLLRFRDVSRGSGTQVPLVDYRNSVVAAWSEGLGRVTSQAEYTPEGRLTLKDAAGNVTCEEDSPGKVCGHPGGTPFGFASAWRSQVTGLVYMRNRWYSPELGEFLSADPLGYHDSFNLYAYTAFDPINGWDPFGLGNDGFARGPFGRGGLILAGLDTCTSKPEQCPAAGRAAGEGMGKLPPKGPPTGPPKEPPAPPKLDVGKIGFFEALRRIFDRPESDEEFRRRMEEADRIAEEARRRKEDEEFKKAPGVEKPPVKLPEKPTPPVSPPPTAGVPIVEPPEPSPPLEASPRKADIKDIDRIVREFNLNKEQRRILHDEITGQNLSLEQIREIAEEIAKGFPKGGKQ